MGKIKISHRKVPESFIDDALEKFKAHDAERPPRSRRNTETSETSDERRSSVDSTASVEPSSSAETPETPSEAEKVPEHNRTMVLQVSIKSLCPTLNFIC